MTGTSSANREIARTMAAVFGGSERELVFGESVYVFKYWDDEERSQIEILEVADCPSSGSTSFSTIGLSGWAIPGSVRPPLGVEVVGTCASDAEEFGSLISTAAFFVINSGWKLESGTILPEVVGWHFPDTTVPHLVFVPPFLWEAELEPRVIGDRTVAWLLAVPMTSQELVYAEQHGSDALEDRFEEAQIDILDLQRDSAV